MIKAFPLLDPLRSYVSRYMKVKANRPEPHAETYLNSAVPPQLRDQVRTIGDIFLRMKKGDVS